MCPILCNRVSPKCPAVMQSSGHCSSWGCWDCFGWAAGRAAVGEKASRGSSGLSHRLWGEHRMWPLFWESLLLLFFFFFFFISFNGKGQRGKGRESTQSCQHWLSAVLAADGQNRAGVCPGLV